MEKRCRICGLFYDILHSVVENETLIDQLGKLIKIKVTERDRLPTLICQSCVEIINSTWQFYDHVYQTESMFREIQHIEQKTVCCWICGYFSVDLTPICNSPNLIDHIRKLYPIKIPGNTVQSAFICQGCKDIVIENWKFYVDVHQVQKMLAVANKPENEHIQFSENCHKEAYDILTKMSLGDDVPMRDKTESVNDRMETDSTDSADEVENEDKDVDEDKDVGEVKDVDEDKDVDEGEDVDQDEGEPTEEESPKETSEECGYICGDCSKAFDSADALKEHFESFNLLRRKINGVLPAIRCICCDKQWKMRHRLSKHEYDTFFDLFRDRLCYLCYRIFQSKRCYTTHSTLHQKLGDYPCTICKRRFLCEDDFTLHQEAHKQHFINSCRICKFDFESQEKLNEHYPKHATKAHTVSHPFFCAICGGGHESKDATNNHVMTHKLRIPVKCTT